MIMTVYHYVATKPLGYNITEVLKLCSSTNAKKISALTKEACIALGLPLDTKGGNKPPEHNIEIFTWLRDNKATTSAESIIDLPIGINAIPVLPDMTLAEAQTKHAELKSVHSLARTMLLEMRDRKGWLALGYSSFSDYGEKEWGYTQSYISRLTTAAAIQEKLNMPIGINEIPESHTRELGNLPNDDAMREVYDRVTAENEKVTAKAIQDAVNEWKAKHDAVQNDLLAVRQQNDDLRGNIDAKVSAAISTEQAALVVESSSAMQALQKQLSDTQDALKKKERENEKAISDGIGKKMLELDNEIRNKEQSIFVLEKRTNELLETKSSLDKEVGAIQLHRQILENAKKELNSFAISFAEAFDIGVIPTEVTTDWQQIRANIKKLDSKMDEFFADNAPIDGAVLVGEVVTL